MYNKDDYKNPELTFSKLDTYVARKSILSALKKALPELKGILLDVGCGYQPYKSLILEYPSRVDKYIGLDLKDNVYIKKPDLEWDGSNIPLPESSMDCALATELFEHCPEPEAVMQEINRVLKPGGMIFFTVPFLWNLHSVPNDEYRFTPFSLERHLKNAGFRQIDIKALGGWNASMAQMIGLWIKRGLKYSIMQKVLQLFLLPMLLPVIWFLLKTDINPDSFKEGQMITGIYGTALKSG